MQKHELLEVKGVGPVSLEKLRYLGIDSKRDLSLFSPTKYIDLDAVSDLNVADDGDFCVILTDVVSVSKPFRKGKLQMFRASGAVEGFKNKVKLVWYNANYVAKTVTLGARLRCYGKIKKDGNTVEFINPVIELAGVKEGELRGVKPIYALKGAIPQATFTSMVRDCISKFRPESVLPHIDGVMDLSDAVECAHMPKSIAEADAGADRIAVESLVRDISAYKLIRKQSKRALVYEDNRKRVEEVENSLPYSLTATQKEAVERIYSTMLSEKPLNAMLVGDVGSGKTAVAMLTAVFSAFSGYQVAIMAPTEILAVQHYNTFTKFLTRFGIRTVLLTGGLSAGDKKKIKTAIANGEADIVVGTHAVISKGTEFARLALAIIDEQHRFGVAQRTSLTDKGNAVDTLTLSATPIPRSLRLTVFGDIDVLNIERRYSANNVKTAVVTPVKRKEMLDYVVEECEKGKQAYVVAPKVYDVEGLEGSAVEKVYKELLTKYGTRVSVGLLHGKQKAQDKQKTLTDFAEGRVQILVSTTVIEVGIDVPNASLMVIFDADRFGLATLHQLRGRIGRNGSDAYCFLYTAKSGDDVVRLTTLASETDGLRIAERDLELRGAGDWLGEGQSGRSGRIDLRLMAKARELSEYVDLDAHYAELVAYALARKYYNISFN